MTQNPTPTARRDAQATRKRLLEAAIDVFSEHGPQAATIDDICSNACVNKRMVYHYFQDKNDLYEESLKCIYERFYSLEIELGTMMLPAEQLLETLVHRYYLFLSEHPQFVRLISYENLNRGQAASKLQLQGQKAPVVTALTLALDKGKSEGRFKSEVDVTDLLVSIFALCFFYFSNHFTMSLFLGERALNPARIEKRIKHVVALLLEGITVHEFKS
ncbi:MAG: TetR/AcrR family transcriptional regulator [Phycisphaerales bacterium]